MTSPSVGAVAPAQSGPPKRRLRNYLLDPRFQLKYAGLLVVVAIALMSGLTVVIWKTANVAASQARNAVQQSESAARQSEQAAIQAERAMQESRTSSRIVRMQQLAEAADNPELVQTITRELEAADREAERNLQQMQRQRAAIVAQRATVEQQRRDIERTRIQMLYTLIAAGLVIVIVLGLAGIVITHKVVGPVFKLKRLLRQVGTGRLNIRERLRRGDELEDLFETFMGMVDSLRKAKEVELARLEAVIHDAESTGASPALIEKLRALRTEMLGSLESPESVRPPAT